MTPHVTRTARPSTPRIRNTRESQDTARKKRAPVRTLSFAHQTSAQLHVTPSMLECITFKRSVTDTSVDAHGQCCAPHQSVKGFAMRSIRRKRTCSPRARNTRASARGQKVLRWRYQQMTNKKHCTYVTSVPSILER
nr:uncharacterized protein LOC119161733 [Rhipicephalus microplus]